MGREKKILLGFLGLLAGVFVGVLSMKLLVPRPPTGAGPDICTDVADSTAQERVEPPAPAPGGWDFAAAPPLVPETPAATPSPASPAATDATPRFSRFASPQVDAPPSEPIPTTDGNVAPAAWEKSETSDDVAALTRAPATERFEQSPARFVAPEAEPLAASRANDVAPPARDPFTAPPRAVPVAGDYLVQVGDSWWDVAERAYGDGRLYRALFAWNRARDPRIALAPGTRLDVPPLARLQTAWPRLLPTATP